MTTSIPCCFSLPYLFDVCLLFLCLGKKLPVDGLCQRAEAFRMIRKASVLSKKVAKSGRAGGTAFCRGFRGRFPKPCATAHFPRTSEALFADAGGRSWVFRQSEACNQADYRLFYFCPRTKSARFLVFKGKNQHFFPALIAPSGC